MGENTRVLAHQAKDIPTTPKASNDELGLEMSGSASRETKDMAESPYRILIGEDCLCSFFVLRG